MHYCLSSNEFMKYGALCEQRPNLRNLKAFLQRYRFNEFFEIYGKENLEEYFDLRIFDSTKEHKEIINRQISANFSGLIKKVEHRRKMIRSYSLSMQNFLLDKLE
jgi:hypothetical protein